jgi:thiosulfate dehydrogenase [quinone] large subunit
MITRTIGKTDYSLTQVIFLLLLRILIGWHLLYEGLAKLMNPSWTSESYLMDSGGMFTHFFQSLASDPDIVKIVDLLNIWGLILIGSALILGLLTRPASIAGIILLALYYISHPPLLFHFYSMPSEGNYFLVDKNLIELVSLCIVYLFPTGFIIGLDRIIFRNTLNKKQIES